jgi:hypothetical protein
MPFSNLFKRLPKKGPDAMHQVSDANKRQHLMPSNSQKNDPNSDLLRSIAQNSIDGNGDRLVLGEGMSPMTEALQHGGRYILVHPDVIRRLEQNGIDSFLIHEAGLKSELSSNISQINFVGGDATKLIRDAQGEPERQLPAHVRQLLWLKENAANYGYVQKGNSWIMQ